MNTNQFFKQIRDLIGRNEIASALEKLRELLEKSPMLDDVIQQSGRFHSIRQQIRLGLVSHSDATLTENQIRHGLLELVSEIEQRDSTDPALQKEIAGAISVVSSRNVVAGSNVSAQNIHIGDVIYQVPPSQSEPAAPSRDYNKTIMRRLVEAMRPYHANAQRLCQDFSWLEEPENLRKVQEFICNKFVGEISKQIRSLVNIADDEHMDDRQKLKPYLKKCLDIAKRTLDLVNFTLISEWWEASKSRELPLSGGQRRILSDFFEKNLETSSGKQVELLRTLLEMFRDHQLPLPLGEMKDLQEQAARDSSLADICRKLEVAVANDQIKQAEALLGDFMQAFGFLSLYRMASIKRITYRKLRNGTAEYQHRYVALGLEVKFNPDVEKERWADSGEQVPAVLLFKGENYEKGISLFPFIIDYNALTFEQGAKVCFFNTRDMGNQNAMEYLFLGDNSQVSILREEINLNGRREDRVMAKEELCKQNFNFVVEAFQEAQNTIFRQADNLFDNL